MPLHRTLPLYALLLAACSAPPGQPQTAQNIHPGADCQDACGAGFRWAVEENLTSDAKCRGEGDFGRGCRAAVAQAHPFNH
ncbi:MAG TPA: hypothetical protein VFM34_01055 [Moraxellaceae bacterium]|nr:hypothetical protein [Moraxellaceae bacterium]